MFVIDTTFESAVGVTHGIANNEVSHPGSRRRRSASGRAKLLRERFRVSPPLSGRRQPYVDHRATLECDRCALVFRGKLIEGHAFRQVNWLWVQCSSSGRRIATSPRTLSPAPVFRGKLTHAAPGRCVDTSLRATVRSAGVGSFPRKTGSPLKSYGRLPQSDRDTNVTRSSACPGRERHDFDLSWRPLT